MYHILCRNYSTSIFSCMVKFGRSVRPFVCLFSAVWFLFFRPSGFGRLGQTRQQFCQIWNNLGKNYLQLATLLFEPHSVGPNLAILDSWHIFNFSPKSEFRIWLLTGYFQVLTAFEPWGFAKDCSDDPKKMTEFDLVRWLNYIAETCKMSKFARTVNLCLRLWTNMILVSY